jgi:hypothetical protein
MDQLFQSQVRRAPSIYPTTSRRPQQSASSTTTPSSQFSSQIRRAPSIDPNPVILRTILAKTIKIKKTLGDNLKSQDGNQKRRVRDERKLKDVINDENKKKKSKGLNLGNKLKISLPKTGILDSIANFMVFTFFGWLFTQTQKYLPKLLGIVGILKGAADGLGFITRFFLDALTSFIGAGYKVYDTIKGKTDEIKAKPVKEKFDSVEKSLYDNLDEVVKFFDVLNDASKNIPVADTPPPKPPKTEPTKSPSVKGAATGAYITSNTRGGTPVNSPVTRGLKQSKTPKKPQKQPIPEGKIGKDSGGEAKVREFYRSPKVGVGGILGIFKPKGGIASKNPVDTLSKISKDLKGRNSLLGDIATVGSDVALGKKPNDSVYRNTAKDVVYLAQFIAQGQQNNLRNSVIGMASGGVIPSRGNNKASQESLVNLVEKVIKFSVEKRVNIALGSLRNPMNFVRSKAQQNQGYGGRPDINFDQNGVPYFDGGYGMPGGGYGAPGGGYGAPGGGYGMPGGFETPINTIEMSGISNNDVLVLGRIIQAEAGSEDNLGKASVMNVILNRYRAIKSGVATPGQFGITGKRAKDVTISDIVYARRGMEFQPVRDGALGRITDSEGQRALSLAIRSGGNDPRKLAELLRKSGKSGIDAEYIVRSVGFYNPYITSSENVPFPTRTVTHGRHGFQESADVKLRGPIGKIDANIKTNLLGVELAGAKGFKTGLKTGPAGSIGAGAAFHIDAKIHNSLSVKERVALVDSMALAYSSEGRQMVFTGSGTGTYRRVWDVNAPFNEKIKLLQSQIDAHSHSSFMRREGFLPFDYYALSTGSTDPYHKSGEYTNIMAPVIPGGTYEYGQGMGYGRHLFLRDKNGRILFMTGHGDEGLPSPKDLGRRFKFDEISEEQVFGNVTASNLPSTMPSAAIPGSGRMPSTKKDEVSTLGSFMRNMNTIFTTNSGPPRERVEKFSYELSKKLKKTKKNEFVDIIHLGERISLKNLGNGKFRAYFSREGRKRQEVDGTMFDREMFYAITMGVPYGEIKNKNDQPYSDDVEKNMPQKMKDRRKRNEEQFNKKFRQSTLNEPSLEQVNTRITNASIGEKFDIIYKGEKFTLKRTSSKDIETYGKGGKLNPGELSTAMAANVPYKRKNTPLQRNIGLGALGGGLLMGGLGGFFAPVAAVAGLGVAAGVYASKTRDKNHPARRDRMSLMGSITPTRRGIGALERSSRPRQSSSRRRPTSTRNQGTTRPTSRPKSRQPQRAWWDIGGKVSDTTRRFLGKKTGGLIGNSLSDYTSYEGSGGISLIAIQPMIIKEQIITEKSNPIPIPFPVASGVNNNNYNRS